MSILIVAAPVEAPPVVTALLGNLGSWFAARSIRWRALSVASPGISEGILAASALVLVGGDQAASALGALLAGLPVDSLAGRPFLWIGPSAPPVAGDVMHARLWYALQAAGVEIHIKPALLDDWSRSVPVLQPRDEARLDDALIALGEGVSFCQRLQRKRDSLSLAVRFAQAPLLA